MVSRFDEGLQPRQSLVPLPGYRIKIRLHLLYRFRHVGEAAFPADAARIDDTCPFQDAQVLGDSLPGQAKAVCQLTD